MKNSLCYKDNVIYHSQFSKERGARDSTVCMFIDPRKLIHIVRKPSLSSATIAIPPNNIISKCVTSAPTNRSFQNVQVHKANIQRKQNGRNYTPLSESSRNKKCWTQFQLTLKRILFGLHRLKPLTWLLSCHKTVCQDLQGLGSSSPFPPDIPPRSPPLPL